MNKRVLPVGAVVACCIIGGAHAENLYWASGTATGDFADGANWRTGSASGAAADRAPVAGSDVANFDGTAATVNFSHNADTTLPKISVKHKGGNDSVVQFNFPAGVTSSIVAEDSAFGFPWDGAGLSKITVGSGTLDLGNKKMSQNNNGAPRLTVSGNGTVMKNVSEWAPKQGEGAGGRVEFEVKDGARVEAFKYLLPPVSKDGEPRSAVTLLGAGTTVKDLKLRKPAAGISFTDIAATDGVKIFDSEWWLATGTALTISGAETYASNLFVKTLRHEASVEIKGGATLEDCSVALAGDAQNEPYSNSVLKVENVTLKRFSFLPRAWSHDCKTTFGPGVAFEELKEFSFTGANNDFRLTGEGVTVDYDGREFLLWGANGMQKDTDGRTIEVDGGAKIECSRLSWTLSNRNAYRNTLRIRGAGSGIWVRPARTDGFTLADSPVRFGYGNNSANVAQHNRVEVTDGATLAVVKREGVDYSGLAYLEGVGFFGAGNNCNTNVMVVANGGTFTNDFNFIFGNTHYDGGRDNAVIVSNGTFHCGGRVRMGVKNATKRNRIEVADGGRMTAAKIEMSEAGKAEGGKLECRGGTVLVAGEIYANMNDAELEPLSITLGGETGGIEAECIDNYNGAPMNLKFEIGDNGRTEAGAYLTLRSADNSERTGALRHPLAGGTGGFNLKLSISPKWAYRAKSSPRAKLISVADNTVNLQALEKIAATADEGELMGCKLHVTQTEEGKAVLELSTAGMRGLRITVR